MTIHKILIGVGILLSSILIIENKVQPAPYVFIWQTGTSTLSLVSIIIGIGIGYGISGFFNKGNQEEDHLDF